MVSYAALPCQAHVATVHTTEDVERVMDELLKNSKVGVTSQTGL
jgi:hypothetical protein